MWCMRCRCCTTCMRPGPDIVVDWVVEPAFAPLLQRVRGVADVIECPLRRWRKAWWTAAGAARVARLARTPAGAAVRRGDRPAGSDQVGAGGPAGARHELRPGQPHRWLELGAAGALAGRPCRSRCRAAAMRSIARARWSAQVLGVPVDGPVRFGLQPSQPVEQVGAPLMVFVHGTSRDDKLWPEADWIALGRRLVAAGWRIALPHAGADRTGAGAAASPRRSDRRAASGRHCGWTSWSTRWPARRA